MKFITESLKVPMQTTIGLETMEAIMFKDHMRNPTHGYS